MYLNIHTISTLERRVSSIGPFSFASSGLETVEWNETRAPSGTLDLGEGAFSHCSGLRKICLPRSVREIQAEGMGSRWDLKRRKE